MEINVKVKKYNLEISEDGVPILVEDDNGILCLANDLIAIETLASHLPTVSMMCRNEMQRNARLVNILSSLNITTE